MNRVQMHATLIERSALRYTPAGIPVLDLQFEHESETTEAGLRRLLRFAFAAIAIGDAAKDLARERLGDALVLDGFLAPRTRRSTRLRLHIVRYAPMGQASAGGQPITSNS